MSKAIFRLFLKGISIVICFAIICLLVRGPPKPNTVSKLEISSVSNNNDAFSVSNNNDALQSKKESAKRDDIKYLTDGWGAEKLSSIGKLYDVPGFDCRGILEGDPAILKDAINRSSRAEYQGFRITDEDYIEQTKDCDKFIEDRGYIRSSLSQAEEDFPLAYSIVAHKDSEQVERLLRAIYRPQNLYCIHIDAKSKKNFYDAIARVSRCFPNVFMASKRSDVQWGMFSVLEPELQCMDELFNSKVNWKYFINLTGQEFPLKNNRELVEILTAYKGANDIEGVQKSASKVRWKDHGDPPDGLTPVKGSVHIVVNREFVDFIVNDARAQRLLEWVKPQAVCDETFFATIGHNPKLKLRGTFLGLADIEELMDRKPWYSRYKSWLDWPCAATRVHDVCILSMGDLPRLNASPFFIANKFYLHEAQIAFTCLEQRLLNATQDLQFGQRIVNVSEYEDSIIVRNRLKPEEIGLTLHERGEGKYAERRKSRWMHHA